MICDTSLVTTVSNDNILINYYQNIFFLPLCRPQSPIPSHSYPPRLSSRSATATPTGSPKKRQLPQIPASLQFSRNKVTQVSVGTFFIINGTNFTSALEKN